MKKPIKKSAIKKSNSAPMSIITENQKLVTTNLVRGYFDVNDIKGMNEYEKKLILSFEKDAIFHQIMKTFDPNKKNIVHIQLVCHFVRDKSQQ